MSSTQVGDIVQLKHGGPLMTVTVIDKVHLGGDALHAWCRWHDSHGNEHKGTYPLAALQKPSKAHRFWHRVLHFVPNALAALKK